ncbi:serine hydrolase [Sphingomonas sp. 28-63-12]|uniref:serine hydrolase domain-containing protein n=1 Tax=Sphingomonas sp. 28-63-12 TaxID=1970434 RepID=UPI000BD505CA|nr:MAG: serine hydrolase [Sphingomonas sp. 28-63-12]
MRRWPLVIGAAACLMLAGAAPAPSAPVALDLAVRAAMTKTGARGIAVALIGRGKPVFVRSYGTRNAAGAPLNADTIMYGASITKAVFAYMVMQLVDEGRIDLDRPLADYLAKPLPAYGNLDAYGNWGDLAGDDRWRTITARHILTHSTGFANFAFLESDGKLRIHFAPGTRYAYSGEGMMLLQFAIERGLGLDVGAEMQRRVFDRFGMANTSLKWRADFARNLADGWKNNGSIEPHDERSRVRAAGSMDTTIEDMAKFASGFMRGDGISKAGRAEMLRGQLPITTRQQFPTLLPELPLAERSKGLSAGLGVVTFDGPQGPGFYKGGHNDSTANTWVCLKASERCVIILSNDVRAEKAFPALVRAALGETGAPWHWEYGLPQ